MKKSDKSNVVVFGGAFAHQKYLNLAYNTGKYLAKHGFVTITGGGSGMMEQVNKGAFEAGGDSIGIRLKGLEEKLEGEYFTSYEWYELFTERHDRLLSLGVMRL